jgi:hypothetical protein
VDSHRDAIRRAADAADDDAADAEHHAEMREWPRRLDWAMDPGSGVDPMHRQDVILGGFNRRRFLTIGGTSLMVAAVAAACGSTQPPASGGATTTTLAATPGDVLALRTASSLENAANQLYTKALAGNLIASTSVSDAFKLFQTHHTDHSLLLQAKTTDAGGQPYGQPNSLIMDTIITPRLAKASSERDLTQLAYDVEKAMAATYQADAGNFANIDYNVAVMSIGGIEARHVSVFAGLLGHPELSTDGAFQMSKGGVGSGSGLAG